MSIPFQWYHRFKNMWPWLWTLTYFCKALTLPPQTNAMPCGALPDFVISILVCIECCASHKRVQKISMSFRPCALEKVPMDTQVPETIVTPSAMLVAGRNRLDVVCNFPPFEFIFSVFIILIVLWCFVLWKAFANPIPNFIKLLLLYGLFFPLMLPTLFN